MIIVKTKLWCEYEYGMNMTIVDLYYTIYFILFDFEPNGENSNARRAKYTPPLEVESVWQKFKFLTTW